MLGFPTTGPGQTIGLLGGSFDPPHSGHALISRAALTRFGLDRLWWLVSPGNPLKPNPPATMEARMAAARKVMEHPRVTITALEAKIGTRYTAETLKALKAIYPDTNFVWLMGADNLTQFHHWQDWRWIMENVPVGILARPGQRISARMSKAGRIYRDFRVSGRASQLLANHRAPAWCFVNVPMSDQSSSAIRARGEWGQ